jgi:hypothetical protein
MSDLVASLVREFAQKAVGIVALWLAAHGLNLPQSVTDWATLTLIGASLWLWTAIVRWLETRAGDTPEGRFARLIARILMLGIATRPTYAPPAQAGADR